MPLTTAVWLFDLDLLSFPQIKKTRVTHLTTTSPNQLSLFPVCHCSIFSVSHPDLRLSYLLNTALYVVFQRGSTHLFKFLFLCPCYSKNEFLVSRLSKVLRSAPSFSFFFSFLKKDLLHQFFPPKLEDSTKGKYWGKFSLCF